MSKQGAGGWFCPIYSRDIAEGKCLDINYERIGYMESGCFEEIRKLFGFSAQEIESKCKGCPRLPFNDESEFETVYP